VLQNRTIVPGIEALCILLRHLARQVRNGDLSYAFHRDETTISRAFNAALKHVDAIASKILFWDARRLTPEKLRQFAQVIREHSVEERTLGGIFGFIDGTFVEIARPSDAEAQLASYSGYKREHGIKFQAIVGPDGLAMHVSHAVPGRRNDLGLLAESRLVPELRRHLAEHEGELYMYGDAAYRSQQPWIKIAPTGVRELLEPHVRAESASINADRTVVENYFGDISK
jgi:hypothetical protein